MKTLNLILLAALLIPMHSPCTQAQANGHYGNRYIEYFNDDHIRIGQQQVWSICEGEAGFMFFAVNEGLAMYDGVRWRLYQTPGNIVIRALHYDNNSGRLYSAGVNEFGYWMLDTCGQMEYTRMFKNERFRELSYDFWRIAHPVNSESIWFQSHGIILIYNILTGEISSLEPARSFAYMHTVGNRIYVQDGQELFLVRSEGEREKICDIGSRVVNMFADNQGLLILAIEHLGIFRLDGGRLDPVDEETNRLLSSAKIMSCEKYGDDMLLVGTTRGGLFVLDGEYRVEKGFYKDANLSKTTVLSVGTDAEGDIWLGMDGGIARIDNSSNEYYILDNEIGRVQTLVPHGDRLVAGSNKGLFLLSGNGSIEPVPGSQGMVWKLIHINNNIFVLHDQGIFLFENDRLFPVHKGGIMNLVQLYNEKRFYIAGDYNGLSLYETVDGRLRFVNTIDNYGGYTRNFFIDKNDNIWVPVLGVGFMRLSLSDDKTRVAETRNFDVDFSGPDNMVFCTFIDGEPVLYADEKAHSINYIKDTLEYNPSYTELLKLCGKGLTACTQIGNRFWYISDGDVGYIERSGGILTKYAGLFGNIYDRRLSHDFFRVNGQTAIGFHNGIGLVTSGRKNVSRIQIGIIEAYGTRETLLYDRSKERFDIPNTMNNIRIYPVRMGVSRMVDYRIIGLDDQWTTVNASDYVHIASLPAGHYTVEVRLSGQPLPDDTVSFRICVERPWYFSNVAITFYLIVVIIILLLIRVYYHWKNRRAEQRIKQSEKEKRERQLEELEKENLLKEKRITELEKERLKTDIRQKDKRLANLTMNSMKRNSMLSELKQEIGELTQIESAAKIKSSLTRVLRKINTLMNNDEDWPLAEKYFNNIYDGLLDRLRTAYPNISQTDLKLCVYIKLNLSTKEIAEIMNISTRSVEMARYRLRKKLGLRPDESIGDILK